ncbi:MAG TPA: efflux RND transporter periplasmic adaptor subunit, partial [Pseudoxanthomonas sp.]|nr:efflux RND transporter periplasmic adaptor subunit [Pseudoxanthomonas sp.]
EHTDEPALVYTDHTESTELFVEFPPLVVDQASTLAAHVTRLSDFGPLTSGVMDVSLLRGSKTVARFRVREPARKGIFTPAVTPKQAGDYQLRVEVRDGDLHAVHDLGTVTVFADTASTQVNQTEPPGDLRYLKEQQWDNPFAARRAAELPLRPSVPGFGTVLAPADGSATVRAPSDGYYTATDLVNAGDTATAGQLLGYLVPRLGEGADIGNLLVEIERARSQLALARQDVERLQALFEQGAVPERRLIEARQTLEVAEVETQTTQSRLQQRQGSAEKAGIALRAPIAGEVVAARARPGAFVRSGDALFALAAAGRRWLEVQVPERYAEHLRSASGAWLLLESPAAPIVLDAQAGARLIAISSVIDPTTRTAAVTLEYPSEAGPTLIGSRFPAHVFYGQPVLRLAVPRSAVIDDGGQPVVYVQTGGETFDRRPVRLGVHDGPWVEVLNGVDPGEWVVSEGAYYVKLAAAGGEEIGHGHAH